VDPLLFGQRAVHAEDDRVRFEVMVRPELVTGGCDVELRGAFATFLTMAYILFVNPAILGSVKDSAGTTLSFPAVLTVTALVAGVMTLAMGIYANYPFAIAAGLGLNAFVTFTLVATLGLTWPQARGVSVSEGAVITLLVLTGFREAVLNAIPMDLKRAIGIGIGLFLAIIGLVNGGIVVGSPATLITLNPDLSSLHVLVFVFGLIAAMVLVAQGEGRSADRDTRDDGFRDHPEPGVRELRGVRHGHRGDPQEDRVVTGLLAPGELQLRCLRRPRVRDRDGGDPRRHALGLLRHHGHRRGARR
jgi:hypothetical protein